MGLWKQHEDDDPSLLGEWSALILERAQLAFENWLDRGPGRRLSEGTMTTDDATVAFYYDVIPTIAAWLLKGWQIEHIVSLITTEPCWLTWQVGRDEVGKYLERYDEETDEDDDTEDGDEAVAEPQLTMLDMLTVVLENWLCYRLAPHFVSICRLYDDLATHEAAAPPAAANEADMSARLADMAARANALAEALQLLHQQNDETLADWDDETDEEV